MKKVHILLAAAFALVGMAAMAQQDFSGPQFAKWGDTPEAREANILASNFLAESVKGRNYNEAAIHLQELIKNRPQASVNTFKYGKIIYRNKIDNATSNEQKQALVDSLLLMYDLQAQYFGEGGKESVSDILGTKANEVLLYRSNDREAVRNAFRAAIKAGGEDTNPETVAIYFQNLCDDYQNGEVVADEVVSEYENLEPVFAKHPEAAELRGQFDAAFGRSGVASCENLEKIFSAKIAANPTDEKTLGQAVSLMARAKCNSAFFFQTAEQYYQAKPSADTALALAQIFQDEGQLDKAVKYLREALNSEKNTEAREKLLARIGLVELVANNVSAAATAVRQALDLNPENGLAYFVLAQCYAASAAACGGFNGQTAFWAAYDTMSKAINYMSEEEAKAYGEAARTSLNGYRSRFPTAEECFFNELKEGQRYTVACGTASGVATTVRTR